MYQMTPADHLAPWCGESLALLHQSCRLSFTMGAHFVIDGTEQKIFDFLVFSSDGCNSAVLYVLLY